MKRIRPHLTYANVMATLALFVALGGSSYAALNIRSSDVVNNSLRSEDVRNNELTGRDIKNGRLGGRRSATRRVWAAAKCGSRR